MEEAKEEQAVEDLVLLTEVMTYDRPTRKLRFFAWDWAEESDHIGPIALQFNRDGYVHYWYTRREPYRPREEKEPDRFSVLITLRHIVEMHEWLISQADYESAYQIRKQYPVVFARLRSASTVQPQPHEPRP